MKRGELNRIKKCVTNFLKSNKSVLKIECRDENLNPTKYYHNVLMRDPFNFFFKLIIHSIGIILPASEFKNILYRLLGMKIGKGVSISTGVIFDMGYPKLISIGDGTIIGTGVKILTHETTVKRIRIGRVKIGKKSLIGLRSIIRSGTSVGNYAVVGAGSFLKSDVGDYEFFSGVPARKVKKLRKVI